MTMTMTMIPAVFDGRRLRSMTQLALLPLLLLSTTGVVTAEKDSNPYPWGENPNNQFKMYWNDAANVLEDLDKFSALYIRYHGCVWSECSIDSFDDDGENHDGDQYWYQTRTQPFCANAAYSLYGILKGSVHVGSSCSRGTFINSFFTYGGADILIEALDMDAGTAFDVTAEDDGATLGENAVCSEVQGQDEGKDGGHRLLNDKDKDGDNSDSTSTTMGCSANSQFVTALFTGNSCDGKYFLQTTAVLGSYNTAMEKVRCKQIWNYRKHYDSYALNKKRSRQLDNNNGDNGYTSPAELLLSNSWACDIAVYPHGCPDPFGLKRRYDSVMQAVSSGRSSRVAVTNARLKRPLTAVSWLVLLLAAGFMSAAYYISNRLRIQKRGLLPIAWEDFNEFLASTGRWVCETAALVCACCCAIASSQSRRDRKLERDAKKQQRREEKQARKEDRKRAAEFRRQKSLDSESEASSRRFSVKSHASSTRSASKSRGAEKTGFVATFLGRGGTKDKNGDKIDKISAGSRRNAEQKQQHEDEAVEATAAYQNMARYPSGRLSLAEASLASAEDYPRTQVV